MNRVQLRDYRTADVSVPKVPSFSKHFVFLAILYRTYTYVSVDVWERADVLITEKILLGDRSLTWTVTFSAYLSYVSLFTGTSSHVMITLSCFYHGTTSFVTGSFISRDRKTYLHVDRIFWEFDFISYYIRDDDITCTDMAIYGLKRTILRHY